MKILHLNVNHIGKYIEFVYKGNSFKFILTNIDHMYNFTPLWFKNGSVRVYRPNEVDVVVSDPPMEEPIGKHAIVKFLWGGNIACAIRLGPEEESYSDRYPWEVSNSTVAWSWSMILEEAEITIVSSGN